MAFAQTETGVELGSLRGYARRAPGILFLKGVCDWFWRGRGWLVRLQRPILAAQI